VLAAAWVAALPARGDVTDLLAESWRWRIFDRKEGLGAGSVTALHQDRREMIHAAGERGLWRYDLWEWSPVQSAQSLDDGPVLRFLENATGLHALTAGVLWRVEASALRALRRGSRLHAAVSPTGELYVVDEGARAHFLLRGEALEPADATVQLPAGHILGYEIDARRIHWLATSDGLHWRDMGQRAWRETEDRGLDARLAGAACTRLLAVAAAGSRDVDAGGELWAVFQSRAGGPEPARTLARLEGGLWVRVAPLEGPAVTCILRDLAGRYYATAEDGRLLVSPDGTGWQSVPGLGLGARVAVRGGTVDSAGVLWFQLGTGGVASFDAQSRRWESIPTGLGDPFPDVLSLCEADAGDVWIGSAKGLTRVRRGGPPEAHTSILGTPLQTITGLGEDAAHRIWVSSSKAFGGAFTFDPGDESWVRVSRSGFQDFPVPRIVRDRAGELWLLSRQKGPDGHVIYRTSLLTALDLEPVLVPHGPVNDLLRAADDTVWIATDDGLLHGRVDESSFRLETRLTERDGLLSLQVWSVAEGADGALWICYPSSAAGVTRLAGGEASSFLEADGLASSEVWSLAVVGPDLWLGTGRGVSRFDGACWYNYPVVGAELGPGLVWPLIPSRVEADTVLLGTFGQGALRLRLEDRRRPQITRVELPEQVSESSFTVRWDGRDHRAATRSEDLLFRSRLDGEPWTPFSRSRSREMQGLAVGRHVLELEVRDLEGNRNREDVVRWFEVGSPSPWRSTGAVPGLAGAALLVIGALGAVMVRRRRRGRALLLASYPGAALIVDRGGTVRAWSGAARDVAGLDGASAAQVIGRPLSLVPALAPPAARAAVDRALAGEPAAVTLSPSPAVDGRVLAIRAFPLGAGKRGRRGAVVLIEDVTARIEEERQRERERRLESLQRLAARLAREVGDAGAARKLAAFAGTDSGDSDASPAAPRASANAVLDRLIREKACGGAASVDFRAQPGLWDAAIDPARLEMALREVLKNALAAAGARGTVTVRTANVRLDDGDQLARGAYVEVQIADAGPGLEPRQLDRLFEPFATTRLETGALGLGLPAAFGILRAAQGGIRVASRPGAGTVVRLLIPRAGGPVPPAGPI
jgi:ligand-binding sensor domain-containing protein